MQIQTSIVNNSFVSVNQTSLQGALAAVADKHSLRFGQILRQAGHLKAAKGDTSAVRALYTLQGSSDRLVALKDSPVAPRIQVKDQTFAGSSLTIRLGLWRQICSNGLMGFKWSETRLPHFKKNTDLFNALDETVERLIVSMPELIKRVESLQGQTINWSDVIGQLGLSSRMVREVSTTIQTGRNRMEDDPHTVWGLYNIINEIDRRTSRGTAYLSRDEQMLERIISAA